MRAFLIVLSGITVLACGSSEPKPQEPTVNFLVEHQRRQCEEFESEYLAAVRWCNDPSLTEGARAASCSTANNYVRDCTQIGTDGGDFLDAGIDAGTTDGGLDSGQAAGN